MGKFLNAAYDVLRRADCPLSAREITERAIQEDLLASNGATPWQTMKSKLSTNILLRKDRSLFMRSDAGRFALREWENRVSEHVASRFKKSLFDENILVVRQQDLFKYVSKPGLSCRDICPRQLLADSVPLMRRKAEIDYSVIQLVSVYIVSYRNKYLTYKRTKRLPESRLHDCYSMVFGGHLNPDDIPNLFLDDHGATLQILHDIVRELREELILSTTPAINFRGLLYDDSREISRQHIGIVYDVRMRSPEYKIGERGFLMDAKFEGVDEILDRADDFENWSVLVAQEESVGNGLE